MSTTEQEQTPERESGFEWKGRFYVWHLSDTGKDLMIIDAFTQMPVHEFFSLIEDSFDRGRGPVLLAMIGTSIRNGNPDWSVQRIVREVSALSMSEDITFIDLDEEGEEPDPTVVVALPEGSDLAPVASPEPSPTSSESPAPASEPLSGIQP
jgi:hypothetical protein